MKRTLFVVAVMVAFAASASAATLSIVSDKTTYNVGETITLTVTGDDDGVTTPTAVTANAVQGRIDFDGSLVNLGSVTQTQLIGAYGKWTVGTAPSSDTEGAGSFQFMFNQTAGAPMGANNLPGTLSIGTLIAQAAGTVNISWHTTLASDALDFFGLTNAPGTSFTISGVVPEPTTAGLLGLGLIGLALGGRRRS